MSKLSVLKFRMPAMGVAAIAVLTVAIGGGAVMFLSSRAQGVHATHLSANKSHAPAMTAEQRGRVRASLDALPLAFEANQGQTDPQVKYTARGNGYSVFLTASDAVFAITSAKHLAEQPSRTAGTHSRPRMTEKNESAAIDMRLVGGNLQPEIVAGNELPGVTNYYVGSDPKNWHTGVKQYSAVSYREVYPGVNMVFHGAQRQLEFDFVVSPGADPKTIGLGFKGAKKLATDAVGNLVLASSAGDVVLHKPVAYQEKDGKREIVDAAFRVSGSEVGLTLGAYDRGRELVIDPTLSYATYLGGNQEDDALGIAVDGAGNAYITGQTKSAVFPVSVGKPAGPNFDVFVTKLNTAGTALAYTAIFAGAGDCSGNAIAVDSSGNAYVAGAATVGFPLVSALQSVHAGGTLDAFVLKLNSTGAALLFSTYVGGGAEDIANAVALDGSGNVYVAGDTSSIDLNVTSNAIQGSNNGADDAFMAKMDSSGSSLSYLTYLGGSSSDLGIGIAVDGSNNAYVAGITLSSDFPVSSGAFQTTAGGMSDAFVVKINADGTKGYATYLGGSAGDDAFGIAVDSVRGEAYVTGTTSSSNFPTLNAAQSAIKGGIDSFVTKLNTSGSGLLFSTYLGGTLEDAAIGIALDSLSDAYVTGRTYSSDFPVTDGGVLTGSSDAFVAELSNTGYIVYASYIGGDRTEDSLGGGIINGGAIGAVAVDASANAYLTGTTDSTVNFPVTGGVLQASNAGGFDDGFVVKVGAAPADFSVAVSPGNASVTSGQTTSSITVTVSSVNSSFGQAVTLSCGNLPAKAVCHFNPASVTPGGSPQTSSLTIATNGASSASLAMPGSHGTQVLAALVLPIFGITLLGAGMNPRKKRLFGFLLLGLVLAGLMILPACGGSGGGGGGGGGGTTPGTYNITVSGAGGGANHSAGLTFKVN